MISKQRFNVIREVLENAGLAISVLNVEQFDKLKDTQLFIESETSVIVEKIKAYEKYIHTHNSAYPEYIMMLAREFLGLDMLDTSRDDDISDMQKIDILSIVFANNNVMSFANAAKKIIEDIWNVKLDDNDTSNCQYNNIKRLCTTGADGHTVYLQGVDLPIMVNSIWDSDNNCIPSSVCEMHIGKENGRDVLLIAPSITALPEDKENNDE